MLKIRGGCRGTSVFKAPSRLRRVENQGWLQGHKDDAASCNGRVELKIRGGCRVRN